MPTITAQSVLRRVVDILQDSTSQRWTLNELVRYLNDGQRVMLEYRPDLFSVMVQMTCSAGTKQTLPVTAARLLGVVRNNSTYSTNAVRLAVREHLDAQRPGWHTDPANNVVAHYMVDPRARSVFYVYPPATTNAKLDVLLANYPTDIAEPGVGTQLPASSATDQSAPAVVIGIVSCPDEIAVALVDYILGRAFLKQAQYAGDMQRAAQHLQAFAQATGIELKGLLSSGPTSNSRFNPMYPAISSPGA